MHVTLNMEPLEVKKATVREGRQRGKKIDRNWKGGGQNPLESDVHWGVPVSVYCSFLDINILTLITV